MTGVPDTQTKPATGSPIPNGPASSATPTPPSSTPSPPIVKDYYGNVVTDPSKPYVTGVREIPSPAKGQPARAILTYSTGNESTQYLGSPSVSIQTGSFGNDRSGNTGPNQAELNKAIQDSGIKLQSAGIGDNGNVTSGGQSVRDQYAQTAIAEYVASQGKNGAISEKQLSNTLGLVGLSYDPNSKTITDPLQTQNIQTARENSTKGGYAGLGSGGPETPQSAGRNEGQAAHNYFQDNYSPEQYASLVSAVKTNQEYGNNQSFLKANIGTENSTGSPITIAGKNAPPPDISSEQSKLLGEGLISLSKKEGKTELTVASLTSKINNDIQKRNDAVDLQNAETNQILSQLNSNNAVNYSIDKLGFVSGLIKQAKDNGAKTIDVSHIENRNEEGLQISKSSPLESVPIDKANSRINEIIRNEKNPESLAFSFKQAIAIPQIGVGLETELPSEKTQLGVKIDFKNPLTLDAAIATQSIGLPLSTMVSVISNTVFSGVGLVESLPSASHEIADIISKGKYDVPTLMAVGNKIFNPLTPEAQQFVKEGTPNAPPSFVGGSIDYLSGKGTKGFSSGFGLASDIIGLGTDIGLMSIGAKDIIPLRYSTAILEKGQGLVENQVIYKAVTLGYKEGGSGIILVGKAPNGPIIFGTPKPEAYLPEKYDINLGGRGFTGSEGGGLLNKLLNSDKVLNYQVEKNILTNHDVELFQAVRDATPVVVKAPVTVFHSTFGEQPLDTVLSGAETAALKDIIKTGQKEKGLTAQYGSFADVPFVPGKVNVGDLDLAVNSAEHQKEIGLFAEQKLNEAVKSHNSNNLENIVYHGTTPENAMSILQDGFDFAKSKTSEDTMFARKSISGTYSHLGATLEIKIKEGAKVLDVNKGFADWEDKDIREYAKENGYDVIENLMQGDNELEIVSNNAIEYMRPLEKIEVDNLLNYGTKEKTERIFKFEKQGNSAGVFLYEKGNTHGTKIIDLPIKGLEEEGGSLSPIHQVFGVKEPTATFDIEGISTKTPHYNTVRRSTTLTRIGSKDMKSAIPGFGYTTKYGNYVGPEIGRLKDAARTYRGYILAAKAFREKGNNKAADLLENSALTIKDRFQHRYNFKEALYEIRGETVFNTRPEENESSSPLNNSTVLKETPLLSNHKKESVAKQEYNLRSASRANKILEPKSAAKSAYRGSASKSAYREPSSRLNSIVNRDNKSPSLSSSRGRGRSSNPSNSLGSQESPGILSPSDSPSLTSKSPSLSTLGITNSPGPVIPFNNPLTSRVETNPFNQLINNRERTPEIIIPDLMNKTTEGIKPKPKPRADFLGNTSEGQVVGLFNRSETTYGLNRINKLRSKDQSIITKGFGHLVTKKAGGHSSNIDKLLSGKSKKLRL